MSEITIDDEVSIYLAGHIDNVDDPNSWRNEVKERYDMVDVNWVDPCEEFPDYGDDEYEVVRWCLDQIEECDGILVGKWYPDVPSRGTMREIGRARSIGKPVVLVYGGFSFDLSPFVRDCLTSLVDELDEGIDELLYQVTEVKKHGEF